MPITIKLDQDIAHCTMQDVFQRVSKLCKFVNRALTQKRSIAMDPQYGNGNDHKFLHCLSPNLSKSIFGTHDICT